MAELTLDNLADGLETFRDRYQALDVFIEDVPDFLVFLTTAALEALSGPTKDGSDYLFKAKNRAYRARFFPAEGVARVTRDVPHGAASGPNPKSVALGAATGGAIGAAVSSNGNRSGAVVTGMLLGLLVGAAIGAPTLDPPARRIFALRFDPAKGSWQAYEGGLVPWMKTKLAAPKVLEDLPLTEKAS